MTLQPVGDAVNAPDEPLATAMAQASYYARRAGYLEGAMWIIANGHAGDDPPQAAQRVLDAVGEDEYARRLRVTEPLPKEKRA